MDRSMASTLGGTFGGASSSSSFWSMPTQTSTRAALNSTTMMMTSTQNGKSFGPQQRQRRRRQDLSSEKRALLSALLCGPGAPSTVAAFSDTPGAQDVLSPRHQTIPEEELLSGDSAEAARPTSLITSAFPPYKAWRPSHQVLPPAGLSDSTTSAAPNEGIFLASTAPQKAFDIKNCVAVVDDMLDDMLRLLQPKNGQVLKEAVALLFGTALGTRGGGHADIGRYVASLFGSTLPGQGVEEAIGKMREDTRQYLRSLQHLSEADLEVDFIVWDTIRKQVEQVRSWCRERLNKLAERPLSPRSVRHLRGDRSGGGRTGQAQKAVSTAIRKLVADPASTALSIRSVVTEVKRRLDELNRAKGAAESVPKNDEEDLPFVPIEIDATGIEDELGENRHFREAVEVWKTCQSWLKAASNTGKPLPKLPEVRPRLAEALKRTSEVHETLYDLAEWAKANELLLVSLDDAEASVVRHERQAEKGRQKTQSEVVAKEVMRKEERLVNTQHFEQTRDQLKKLIEFVNMDIPQSTQGSFTCMKLQRTKSSRKCRKALSQLSGLTDDRLHNLLESHKGSRRGGHGEHQDASPGASGRSRSKDNKKRRSKFQSSPGTENRDVVLDLGRDADGKRKERGTKLLDIVAGIQRRNSNESENGRAQKAKKNDDEAAHSSSSSSSSGSESITSSVADLSSADREAKRVIQAHERLLSSLRDRKGASARQAARAQENVRFKIEWLAARDVARYKRQAAESDAIRVAELTRKLNIAKEGQSDYMEELNKLRYIVRTEVARHAQWEEALHLHSNIGRLDGILEEKINHNAMYAKEVEKVRALFQHTIETIKELGMGGLEVDPEEMKLEKFPQTPGARRDEVKQAARAFLQREKEKENPEERVGGSKDPPKFPLPEIFRLGLIAEAMQASPPLAASFTRDGVDVPDVMRRLEAAMTEGKVNAALAAEAASLEIAGRTQRARAAVKRTVLSLAAIRAMAPRRAASSFDRWDAAWQGVCAGVGPRCRRVLPDDAPNSEVLRQIISNINIFQASPLEPLPRYFHGAADMEKLMENLLSVAGRLREYWVGAKAAYVAQRVESQQKGPRASTDSAREVSTEQDLHHLGPRFLDAIVRVSTILLANCQSLLAATEALERLSGTVEELEACRSDPKISSATTSSQHFVLAARDAVCKRASVALVNEINTLVASLETLRTGTNLHTTVLTLRRYHAEFRKNGMVTQRGQVRELSEANGVALLNSVLRGTLSLLILEKDLTAGIKKEDGRTHIEELAQTVHLVRQLGTVPNPVPVKFFLPSFRLKKVSHGAIYGSLHRHASNLRSQLNSHLMMLQDTRPRGKRMALAWLMREGNASLDILIGFWKHEVRLLCEVAGGRPFLEWRAGLQHLLHSGQIPPETQRFSVSGEEPNSYKESAVLEGLGMYKLKPLEAAQLQDWLSVLQTEQLIFKSTIGRAKRRAMLYCLGPKELMGSVEPNLWRALHARERRDMGPIRGFDAASSLELETRLLLGRFEGPPPTFDEVTNSNQAKPSVGMLAKALTRMASVLQDQEEETDEEEQEEEEQQEQGTNQEEGEAEERQHIREDDDEDLKVGSRLDGSVGGSSRPGSKDLGLSARRSRRHSLAGSQASSSRRPSISSPMEANSSHTSGFGRPSPRRLSGSSGRSGGRESGGGGVDPKSPARRRLGELMAAFARSTVELRDVEARLGKEASTNRRMSMAKSLWNVHRQRVEQVEAAATALEAASEQLVSEAKDAVNAAQEDDPLGKERLDKELLFAQAQHTITLQRIQEVRDETERWLRENGLSAPQATGSDEELGSEEAARTDANKEEDAKEGDNQVGVSPPRLRKFSYAVEFVGHLARRAEENVELGVSGKSLTGSSPRHSGPRFEDVLAPPPRVDEEDDERLRELRERRTELEQFAAEKGISGLEKERREKQVQQVKGQIAALQAEIIPAKTYQLGYLAQDMRSTLRGLESVNETARSQLDNLTPGDLAPYIEQLQVNQETLQRNLADRQDEIVGHLEASQLLETVAATELAQGGEDPALVALRAKRQTLLSELGEMRSEGRRLVLSGAGLLKAAAQKVRAVARFGTSGGIASSFCASLRSEGSVKFEPDSEQADASGGTTFLEGTGSAVPDALSVEEVRAAERGSPVNSSGSNDVEGLEKAPASTDLLPRDPSEQEQQQHPQQQQQQQQGPPPASPPSESPPDRFLTSAQSERPSISPASPLSPTSPLTGVASALSVRERAESVVQERDRRLRAESAADEAAKKANEILIAHFEEEVDVGKRVTTLLGAESSDTAVDDLKKLEKDLKRGWMSASEARKQNLELEKHALERSAAIEADTLEQLRELAEESRDDFGMFGGDSGHLEAILEEQEKHVRIAEEEVEREKPKLLQEKVQLSKNTIAEATSIGDFVKEQVNHVADRRASIGGYSSAGSRRGTSDISPGGGFDFSPKGETHALTQALREIDAQGPLSPSSNHSNSLRRTRVLTSKFGDGSTPRSSQPFFPAVVPGSAATPKSRLTMFQEMQEETFEEDIARAAAMEVQQATLELEEHRLKALEGRLADLQAGSRARTADKSRQESKRDSKIDPAVLQLLEEQQNLETGDEVAQLELEVETTSLHIEELKANTERTSTAGGPRLADLLIGAEDGEGPMSPLGTRPNTTLVSSKGFRASLSGASSRRNTATSFRSNTNNNNSAPNNAVGVGLAAEALAALDALTTDFPPGESLETTTTPLLPVQKNNQNSPRSRSRTNSKRLWGSAANAALVGSGGLTEAGLARKGWRRSEQVSPHSSLSDFLSHLAKQPRPVVEEVHTGRNDAGDANQPPEHIALSEVPEAMAPQFSRRDSSYHRKSMFHAPAAPTNSGASPVGTAADDDVLQVGGRPPVQTQEHPQALPPLSLGTSDSDRDVDTDDDHDHGHLEHGEGDEFGLENNAFSGPDGATQLSSPPAGWHLLDGQKQVNVQSFPRNELPEADMTQRSSGPTGSRRTLVQASDASKGSSPRGVGGSLSPKDVQQQESLPTSSLSSPRGRQASVLPGVQRRRGINNFEERGRKRAPSIDEEALEEKVFHQREIARLAGRKVDTQKKKLAFVQDQLHKQRDGLDRLKNRLEEAKVAKEVKVKAKVEIVTEVPEEEEEEDVISILAEAVEKSTKMMDSLVGRAAAAEEEVKVAEKTHEEAETVLNDLNLRQAAHTVRSETYSVRRHRFRRAATVQRPTPLSPQQRRRIVRPHSGVALARGRPPPLRRSASAEASREPSVPLSPDDGDAPWLRTFAIAALQKAQDPPDSPSGVVRAVEKLKEDEEGLRGWSLLTKVVGNGEQKSLRKALLEKARQQQQPPQPLSPQHNQQQLQLQNQQSKQHPSSRSMSPEPGQAPWQYDPTLPAKYMLAQHMEGRKMGELHDFGDFGDLFGDEGRSRRPSQVRTGTHTSFYRSNPHIDSDLAIHSRRPSRSQSLGPRDKSSRRNSKVGGSPFVLNGAEDLDGAQELVLLLRGEGRGGGLKQALASQNHGFGAGFVAGGQGVGIGLDFGAPTWLAPGGGAFPMFSQENMNGNDDALHSPPPDPRNLQQQQLLKRRQQLQQQRLEQQRLEEEALRRLVASKQWHLQQKPGHLKGQHPSAPDRPLGGNFQPELQLQIGQGFPTSKQHQALLQKQPAQRGRTDLLDEHSRPVHSHQLHIQLPLPPEPPSGRGRGLQPSRPDRSGSRNPSKDDWPVRPRNASSRSPSKEQDRYLPSWPNTLKFAQDSDGYTAILLPQPQTAHSSRRPSVVRRAGSADHHSDGSPGATTRGPSTSSRPWSRSRSRSPAPRRREASAGHTGVEEPTGLIMIPVLQCSPTKAIFAVPYAQRKLLPTPSVRGPVQRTFVARVGGALAPLEAKGKGFIRGASGVGGGGGGPGKDVGGLPDSPDDVEVPVVLVEVSPELCIRGVSLDLAGTTSEVPRRFETSSFEAAMPSASDLVLAACQALDLPTSVWPPRIRARSDQAPLLVVHGVSTPALLASPDRSRGPSRSRSPIPGGGGGHSMDTSPRGRTVQAKDPGTTFGIIGRDLNSDSYLRRRLDELSRTSPGTMGGQQPQNPLVYVPNARSGPLPAPVGRRKSPPPPPGMAPKGFEYRPGEARPPNDGFHNGNSNNKPRLALIGNSTPRVLPPLENPVSPVSPAGDLLLSSSPRKSRSPVGRRLRPAQGVALPSLGRAGLQGLHGSPIAPPVPLADHATIVALSLEEVLAKTRPNNGRLQKSPPPPFHKPQAPTLGPWHVSAQPPAPTPEAASNEASKEAPAKAPKEVPVLRPPIFAYASTGPSGPPKRPVAIKKSAMAARYKEEVARVELTRGNTYLPPGANDRLSAAR